MIYSTTYYPKKMQETDKPTVSAVILSYNRRGLLEKTLSVLEKESYPNLEIIVVDNASTDGSAKMVAEKFPNVKLLQTEKNIGVAACNIGFKAASGKYILVLDDDSYPIDDCVSKAVKKMEENDRIGCITAQIINPDGGIQWPEDKIDEVHDEYCFIGCGAVLRKDVFEKTGFYPDDYFLFHNELVNSLLMLNMGYVIRYYPDIKCMHKSPPTKRMNDTRIYYLVRNGSWNIWQFTPLRYMIFYYPGFLAKNLYLSIKYRTMAGFLRGVIDSYRKFSKYAIKKRSPCNAEVYLRRLRRNLWI